MKIAFGSKRRKASRMVSRSLSAAPNTVSRSVMLVDMAHTPLITRPLDSVRLRVD